MSPPAIRRAAGAFLLAGVAVAPAVSAERAAPVVARSLELPRGATFAPGAAPALDVLATGDVIGYVKDCGCKHTPAGGLARRTWLARRIRETFPRTPTIFVDTGNFSDNPTPDGDLRTRLLLASMVRLGYRAVGVGEKDLAQGYAAFRKRTAGIDLTFLSANVVREGTTEPVFSPYTVVSVPGASGRTLRVGVTAVVRFSPIWSKSGPDGSKLAIASPAKQLARYLPKLRAASDVVIVLGGLPKDDARALAAALHGVDLMIDAYGDEISTVEERSGGTRLVFVGNQGKYVAENRFTLGPSGRVADVRTWMHFLSRIYPSDPAMAAEVAKLDDAIAALRKAPPSPAPAATPVP